MILFAQTVPGFEEAIEAARSRGWEAVFLVVVMACMLGFFVWVIKRQMESAEKREDRLAQRVTTLTDLVNGELMNALRTNSETMGRVLAAADAMIQAANRMCATLERFSSILDVRPCLLPNAEQRKLLREFEEVNDDRK